MKGPKLVLSVWKLSCQAVPQNPRVLTVNVMSAFMKNAGMNIGNEKEWSVLFVIPESFATFPPNSTTHLEEFHRGNRMRLFAVVLV